MGRLVFNTSEALTKCLVGSTPTSSAIFGAIRLDAFESSAKTKAISKLYAVLQNFKVLSKELSYQLL